MSENLLEEKDWVPASCTLPTLEQPLRRTEFDDLFAQDIVALERLSAQQVRLQLRPGAEVNTRAAALASKETSCCSFFTFTLTITGGEAAMTISTDETHADVLQALAERAETKHGGTT